MVRFGATVHYSHLLSLVFVTFGLMSCGSSARAGDSGPADDAASGEGCTLPDGRRIAIGTTAMLDCNVCSCTAMGLACTGRACLDTDASVSDGGASRCDPVLFPFSGVCGVGVTYPCGAPGGPIDPMVTRARCAELCVPAAMRYPELRIADDCTANAEMNNVVSCLCGPRR